MKTPNKELPNSASKSHEDTKNHKMQHPCPWNKKHFTMAARLHSLNIYQNNYNQLLLRGTARSLPYHRTSKPKHQNTHLPRSELASNHPPNSNKSPPNTKNQIHPDYSSPVNWTKHLSTEPNQRIKEVTTKKLWKLEQTLLPFHQNSNTDLVQILTLPKVTNNQQDQLKHSNHLNRSSINP